VSVSAQLATGLLALGFHPKLTGALTTMVRRSERPGGLWADADGPPDILTTLVAADLLGGLDPEWDPRRTIAAVESLRAPSGVWTAYGPETAWLTGEVEDLLERLGHPFPERFRWPQLATEQRDRRTGLPFLGYLADLGRLFSEVPSLSDATVEIAFLDLAGFGAWNNVFGMAAGDEVLRFLADELVAIPDAVAIRDGGDEFIVVRAPGATGIVDAMDRFRHGFPERFRTRFGDDALPVAPRIVVGRTPGARIIDARDRLGIEIADLKKRSPSPGPNGVLAESGTQNGN
jgi:GGDEF domain-containing protein